jgi:hypothetical protein
MQYLPHIIRSAFLVAGRLWPLAARLTAFDRPTKGWARPLHISGHLMLHIAWKLPKVGTYALVKQSLCGGL